MTNGRKENAILTKANEKININGWKIVKGFNDLIINLIFN